MANQTRRNRNRDLADASVRLAPSPIANASYHMMPPVVQQYVIEPTIVNKEPEGLEAESVSESTKSDYQPKSEDAGNQWKRQKRAKNMISGAIALIASIVLLLPYIFGYTGTQASLPIIIVFDKFNTLSILLDGIKGLAELNWITAEAGAVWKALVPQLILTIGILAVLINVIKAVFALLISRKHIKYTTGAIVNLLCVCAILLASLVGAPSVGIDKVDFVADVIKGYATSELFTLVAFAIGYTIMCAICTYINRDKCGYLK